MSLFGCVNDEQFEREVGFSCDDWLQGVLEDSYSEDIYHDDKCTYCNTALHDCSLCGPNVEG